MGDIVQVVVLTAIILLIPAIGLRLRAALSKSVHPDLLREVIGLAEVAVRAAEKLGTAVPDFRGPDKYAYAEKALTSLASQIGVKLTPTQANAVIHSVLAEVEETAELVDILTKDEGTDAA